MMGALGNVAAPMAIVMLISGSGLRDSWILDGWIGVLFGSIFKSEESTYYAPGYSDKGFQRIKVGMSEQEVREHLGEPLRRFPVDGDRTGWLYSWKRTDINYRERVLLFEKGRVVEKYSGYYVD